MVKSSKVSELLNNKFFRNFSFVIIARFSNAFLFFILSFALMKYLSTGDFGKFNDFYASSAIFSFFVNLGIDRSFVAITSKINDKNIFLNYVGLFWRTKLIITLSFLFLSAIYFFISGNKLFLLLVCSGFSFGLSEGIKPLAEAQKKFNIISLLVPIRNIILIAAVGFLIVNNVVNIENIIDALIFANLINLVVFIVAYQSKISNFTFKTTLKFSELFTFAKWLFVKDFFIVFVANLEIIIMGRMIDYGWVEPVALGVYSGAFTLCRILSVITNSLTNVLLPEIAEKTTKQSLSKFLKQLTKSGIYAIILSTGFCFAMIIFVRIVFGDKFVNSEPLFPFIVLGTLFAFYANNISLIFYRKSGLSFIGKLTIVKFIIGVTISILLIPIIGEWGAGISFLTVRLFDLITVFLKAKKVLNSENVISHFE